MHYPDPLQTKLNINYKMKNACFTLDESLSKVL